MLSSTKPRPSHTPSASVASISSARDYDRPSSQATIVSAPSSPSSSSPGAKRPSLSTTMHWLSRSTNQLPTSGTTSSSPYAAPKPVRISEPKFVRGMDSLTQQRSGVLGAGATVVRTPDEALREIASRANLESKQGDLNLSQKTLSLKPKKKKHTISRSLGGPSTESVGSPLRSPPLPPLPCPESDEENMLSRSSSGSSKPRTPHIPAAIPAFTPTPSPVPVPRSPSLRPSLKIRSVPSSEDREIVPPLPSSVPPSPPPPFRPIVVSELPAFPVDPERVIVTLETCTTTYRTSLATVASRPSYLSKYVNNLIARHRADSATSSVYSNPEDDSDDMAIYRKHLASQGLLPQTSYNLHLFLDRPSAPYAHILSYLRSSPSTPENPEVIPRAVLYQTSSQAARLESLIELRDEAAFLGLDALHRMCVDEMIRMRHAPKTHARGNSGSVPSSTSIQSLRASVYTLHTLLERVETDNRSSVASLPVPELIRGSLSNSTREHKDNAMSDPAPGTPGVRLPPTPPSWEGPSHRRNASVPRPGKPAPSGWI
ncbi:hypothetical protein DFP72DRAFT_600735 [Ephemerocybe angulata]|uniref:Uncharacterized protein n=1 Tax=Ephemerocybe angulata TaxID=980116 RepID=A0A8H6IB40_9AGAR|nr:hypothetical protein DFP72DRAFT_600735 [Tulosesus angulatus]